MTGIPYRRKRQGAKRIESDRGICICMSCSGIREGRKENDKGMTGIQIRVTDKE